MAALQQLLTTRKLDAESLARAGFADLTATAGLTWAQLLKRPEVAIEAVLGALREDLVIDPLLRSFVTGHDFSRAEISQNNNGALAPAGRPILESQVNSSVGEHEPGSIRRAIVRNEARAVETEIKFAGYLDQQKKSIEKLKAAESMTIPDWLEYSVISGLSREMQETLERVRPVTLGQASRLPGVTPAALSLVHVSIKLQGERKLQRAKSA